MTFQDYCEEYFDLDTALMTDEQLKSARAAYADFIRTQKTPSEIAKHEKALAKARESRKLAKFYGGKALTGSAAQKKWAEEIRERVLMSSELSDEQKETLVTFSATANTAKFWINNKDKSPAAFDPAIIIAGCKSIGELYNKHYDTLARTGSVGAKERARKEIYEALESLTVELTFDFPNCDFYDNGGKLRKGLKFKC